MTIYCLVYVINGSVSLQIIYVLDADYNSVTERLKFYPVNEKMCVVALYLTFASQVFSVHSAPHKDEQIQNTWLGKMHKTVL